MTDWVVDSTLEAAWYVRHVHRGRLLFRVFRVALYILEVDHFSFCYFIYHFYFPAWPDLMQVLLRWLYDCLRRLRGIWWSHIWSDLSKSRLIGPVWWKNVSPTFYPSIEIWWNNFLGSLLWSTLNVITFIWLCTRPRWHYTILLIGSFLTTEWKSKKLATLASHTFHKFAQTIYRETLHLSVALFGKYSQHNALRVFVKPLTAAAAGQSFNVTGQLTRTLIARRAMYIKPLFWH